MTSSLLWSAACFAVTGTGILTATENKVTGPCAAAIERGQLCEAANDRALEIINAHNVKAITVVQDVLTGNLVTFAASDPANLDITTPLLPLSTVKLFVAASLWDHEWSEKPLSGNDPQSSISEMLVSGNDQEGRRLASLLRASIGTEGVLEDLDHYGFVSVAPSSSTAMDRKFWAEVPPQWAARLMPAVAYHSLGAETPTKQWEDALSIGEERFRVTALHLSRFLQAVGNGGVMMPAVARAKDSEGPTKSVPNKNSIRMIYENAALKLQDAMKGVVERGTAKGVAGVLADTGWKIGGKTGTGPGPEAPGPQSDGWFAGLIFDPQGNARFTIATFVKHGGYGGGNAAKISAELARFLSGFDVAH